MKQLIIFGLALAMLTSCVKNNLDLQESKKESRLMAEVESLRTGDNPQTKSTIEIDGSTARFKWEVGDAISVYTENNSFASYSLEEIETNLVFVSESEATPQIGAIYPYEYSYNSTNIENDRISKVSLQSNYNYSNKQSVDMPMIAYLEGDKLMFKHLCGVAIFRLQNVPENASTLIFKTNSNINGVFDITQPQESDTHNGTINIGENQGSGQQVMITNFPHGDVVDFYVPLPCGEYTGFDLIMKQDDNDEIFNIVSENTFTITRASVKLFEGVNCQNSPGYSTERDALIALYKATDGDNWTHKTNWCSEADISEWYGITTNDEGKVVNIDLRGNNLSGFISSYIMKTFDELTRLYCSGNSLTSLYVGKNVKLEFLECNNNSLKTLDVSNCANLWELNCSSNNLTTLDVSNCANLEELNCSSNKLTTLDVSGCDNLWIINCSNNILITLDVINCAELEKLNCSSNNLTTLDISNTITHLDCSSNSLQFLDLTGNLWYLDCSNNNLSSLDLFIESHIEQFYVGNQNIEGNLVLCLTPEQADELWQDNMSYDERNDGVDIEIY